MKKLMPIHSCFGCYYTQTTDCREHFCGKAGRRKIHPKHGFNMFKEIPSWCPLPNTDLQAQYDELRDAAEWMFETEETYGWHVQTSMGDYQQWEDALEELENNVWAAVDNLKFVLKGH